MILLIGYRTERTFTRFVDYVAEQTSEFDVLDFGDLKECKRLSIRHSPGELFVDFGSRQYLFSTYSAFYSRGYGAEFGEQLRNAASTRLGLEISAYMQWCDQPVVNRPTASASNFNKFAHTQQLKAYGFKTADTVLLGDPQLAREITKADGTWVSKSCSGTRTKTVVLDRTLLNQLDRLSVCPSMFQQRITGPDVRVHVVGELFFPERIVSERVDYRYADRSLPPNKHEDIEVPSQVKEACRAWCRDQDQLFAGFDFKISTEGEWYVLESNPMPGYEPYDRRQKRRISKALYELLTGGGGEPFVTVDRRPILSPF